MSRERPIKLECPNCGLAQTAIVWDSLNANVNPEAREALFEGKINVFVCEACGHQARLDAPLLYHDMVRRFVVQYYSFEMIMDGEFLERFDADGTVRSFANAARIGLPPDAAAAMAYMAHPHLVFDMNELIRYIHFREAVCNAEREAPPADDEATSGNHAS
jgi:hypothetical protein